MTGDVHENIRRLKERLTQDKATAALHRTSIITYKEKLDNHRKSLSMLEKANTLFQKVASDTQKTVEVHIDGLVSSGQSAVFDDPYGFKAEFVAKMNKTVCELYFLRNGNKIYPTHASGGGPVDIASLCLRLAVWGIEKTRPVIWLDEPCKFVSKDRMDYLIDMLKMLTEKLGLQMIMVTHVKQFLEAADNKFTIHKGAVVTEEQGN